MGTPIENNTEELQELLQIANDLPEAMEAPVYQEKTVSPTTEKQTVKPDPDYDALSSVTVNAMPTAEQATPSVSVSSSGLITASATQTAGYVSAGTKSGTKQLTTQGAKTITPSKSAQTAVASGVYTTGAVTVDPIPDSYVQLPTLSSPASAADLVAGKQMIDEEGNPVEGAMPHVNLGMLGGKNYELSLSTTGLSIYGDANISEKSYVQPGDSVYALLKNGEAYMSVFGDAEPEDVAAGKVFTTQSGFARVGTKVDGGNTPPASVPKKDVNFLDYDGTVLYSYTVAEAQALSALPALPEREGLICQGWNFDLATIKSYKRAVNVGAMYITDDGTTRIYIHLEKGRTSPMLGVCPNGTVTVDWGDGTTPDTLTGQSEYTVQWTPTHNYAAPGDYVIRLTVDGTVKFSGSTSTNQYAYILRYSSGGDDRNRAYQTAVKKIEIGNNVTGISGSAFAHCYDLSSVTIPSGVTSIGGRVFYYCQVVRYYDFTNHTSVPTLSNTNAFNSIPTDCEILVPAALYDEWIAATNWSTYASYIKAV